MNYENLQAVFQNYISRFDELHDDNKNGSNEGFKWKAVRCFAEHWNVDADDFPSMFKAAMNETSVLVDNGTVHPIAGINMLLQHEEEREFVRECFRELFSEDGGDLGLRLERVDRFISKINERIECYAQGSWKYPQKRNDAILYLNLWHPWDNYMYKATVAAEWANCIEYGDDFGSGERLSLAKYYRMCDELREEIQKDERILSLIKKYSENAEDSCHIAVYDLMFCAHTYNLYSNVKISTTSAKERILLAQTKERIHVLEEEIHKLQNEYQILETQHAGLPDMTGQTVFHKKFGEGKVVECGNGSHDIVFAVGKKSFEFPKAYTDGFLKAEAGIMQQLQAEKLVRAEMNEKSRLIAKLETELADLK